MFTDLGNIGKGLNLQAIFQVLKKRCALQITIRKLTAFWDFISWARNSMLYLET
jgi:hypothetical protein